MRASRVLTGAVLTAAALAMTAPTAMADPGGTSGASISVTPSVAGPGAEVKVRVDCSAFAHPHPTGVFSDAFTDTVRLNRSHHREGIFWAKATVGSDVDPGKFRVHGTCEGDRDSSEFVTTLTVVRGDREQHDRHGKHDWHHGQPEGPVHAGSGGTSTGMNTAETAGGAGMLSAVALSGGLLLRRRKAQRSA